MATDSFGRQHGIKTECIEDVVKTLAPASRSRWKGPLVARFPGTAPAGV